MAYKNFIIDDLPVTIYKRRSSKYLKLSVTSQGKIHVSIPAWTPYSVGTKFAQSRRQWIILQLPRHSLEIYNGQEIGKEHRVIFIPVINITKPVARIKDTRIIVHYPAGISLSDAQLQEVANNACIRALRLQAKKLLPERLRLLSEKYGFYYSTVRIKQLKSRWGSCDQNKNIVLNLFLVQLPWECIDYVLLHELTHTKVMQHGPRFWQAMDNILPETPVIRRAMRNYQPVLLSRESEQASV